MKVHRDAPPVPALHRSRACSVVRRRRCSRRAAPTCLVGAGPKRTDPETLMPTSRPAHVRPPPERRALLVHEPQRAQRVAALWRLDLDHICAKVPQQRPGKVSSHHLAQIQDLWPRRSARGEARRPIWRAAYLVLVPSCRHGHVAQPPPRSHSKAVFPPFHAFPIASFGRAFMPWSGPGLWESLEAVA